MSKLPLFIKIILFLLLTTIQVAIFYLVVTNIGNGLYLTPLTFNLLFWIVTAVAALTGIWFVNLFRSWTVDELIERMDNPLFINRFILLAQERKLYLQDELNWKIPDPVRVHIVNFDVDGKREKG